MYNKYKFLFHGIKANVDKILYHSVTNLISHFQYVSLNDQLTGNITGQ